MGNWRMRRLDAALALLAALLGAATSGATAGHEALVEDETRASFLVRFVRFVEWPASAFEDERAPIVLCVDANDPLVHPLARIVRGRSVGERPLEVRRRLRGAPPSGCHVAYLRASDEGEVAGIVDYARSAGGLLTVGEIRRFADRGGMVEVVIEASRIRFTVNLSSAERAGLRISSKVLSLGHVVRQPRW